MRLLTGAFHRPSALFLAFLRLRSEWGAREKHREGRESLMPEPESNERTEEDAQNAGEQQGVEGTEAEAEDSRLTALLRGVRNTAWELDDMF